MASVVCNTQVQSDGAPVEDREGAAVAAPSNSNFLVTRGSEEASVLNHYFSVLNRYFRDCTWGQGLQGTHSF